MKTDKTGKYIVIKYMIEGIEIVNKYPVKSKYSIQEIAKNLVMNKIRN